MQVEIITPEMEIFKGEAEAVQFPGLDGSFQVLSGHAPIISALVEGNLKVNLTENFVSSEETSALVTTEGNDQKVILVAIKGGVMEMLNNKVIVLAE